MKMLLMMMLKNNKNNTNNNNNVDGDHEDEKLRVFVSATSYALIPHHYSNLQEYASASLIIAYNTNAHLSTRLFL